MRYKVFICIAALYIPALCIGRGVPEARGQGYPVFDFAALMQAIDQMYATYDQIMATIEQVQNTYAQLQKQIEMVKGMNWDDISLSMSDHNGIPDIRDPINSVTRQVNHNMNLINDVKDTLTKKTVTFGGKKYTFGGLFGFGEGNSPGTTIFDLPMNVVDYTRKTGDEITAGYAGKLTYKQKEAIARRHGLSAQNYAKVRLVEEQSNTLLQDLLTTGHNENIVALLKDAAENQSVIAQMTNVAGESMVAQQQATTTALLNVAGGIARLEMGISRFSGAYALEVVKGRSKEELDADMREVEALKKQNEKIKWDGVPAGF